MALISCPECETKVSDKAMSCPSCGCPISEETQQNFYAASSPTKSRGAHIILGLLFGCVGFHNFYAGHNGRGAFKLILLFIAFVMDASADFRTGFFTVCLVIIAFVSLLEIIAVKNDATGNLMT